MKFGAKENYRNYKSSRILFTKSIPAQIPNLGKLKITYHSSKIPKGDRQPVILFIV